MAVLGAGAMGSWIAADFVLTGHRVRFTVSSRTSRHNAFTRVAAAARNRNLDRLSYAPNASEAASGADLVVESLPEDLELKRSALRTAQQVAPHAILATNTSSLTISSLASGLSNPGHLLGVHYINPPWAFRLVEVIPGEHTDPAVLARVETILTSQDRVPITIKRDIPGFAFNRLQFALLREALHLVSEGILTAPDVDRIVVEGLGRRLALTGPLTTAGIGGSRLFARLAERLYPDLSCAAGPPPDLDALLPNAGLLEDARRTRDDSLAHEADVPRHWRSASSEQIITGQT